MSNPKLIILSEQLRGQTFELTDQKYGIGRSDEMEICIVDPTVSGHHCELQRNEDDTYTAVDESFSTNGTRINGMIITRQKLVNSDILQCGGVECMYDCDSNTPSSVISTQTQIKINSEALVTNTRTNLAPENLQNREKPGVNMAIKIVIAVLIAVVVLLVIMLGLGLGSSGGDAPPTSSTTIETGLNQSILSIELKES
ncbi:MAG: FHA domain-containing protein [Lentisphaeria bacterium]|nr:FHA domain-containing protein [Lentisphaeria bacterium]NQZ69579.1 FHA domain-containing protein [Lentisphaeria bacterium]